MEVSYGKPTYWMNLKPVTQSEVSPKEENIVHEHIYKESRKMVLHSILFSGKERSQIKKTDLWTHWGKRGGTKGESSIDIHTLPCAK